MSRTGFLNVLWVLHSAQLRAEPQIDAQQLIISGIVVQHHGQNLSSSSSLSSQVVLYFSGLPPDFFQSEDSSCLTEGWVPLKPAFFLRACTGSQKPHHARWE